MQLKRILVASLAPVIASLVGHGAERLLEKQPVDAVTIGGQEQGLIGYCKLRLRGDCRDYSDTAMMG